MAMFGVTVNFINNLNVERLEISSQSLDSSRLIRRISNRGVLLEITYRHLL